MGFPALLRRGATAGAAAGVCAALVMWLVVEPVLRRALAVEAARGGHDHGEEPVVSRTVQVAGGLLTAVVVGVIVGVVFTVVFARLRPRLPAATDLGRSLVLAGTGFVVFALLPAIQLPANPPGVGDPATVGERTLIFALTVLLGLLGIGAVLAVDRALRSAVTVPVRVGLDVLAGVVWLVALLVLVPDSPDRIPADVPADLLWDFRVASLAQLAAMWLALGVVFGVLVDGRTRRARRPGEAVPVPG
ncbi:MAG: CbtA family protein [Actinomycetes bacterium]